MIGKAAVAVVSLILFACVIIGVIATVSHRVNSNNDGSDVGLFTGMKAVESICSVSMSWENCIMALAPIARNNSKVTTKDIVKAVIMISIDEMNKVLNNTVIMEQTTTNSTQRMALEDCQEMFQFAIQHLHDCFLMVVDNDLHKMNKSSVDINLCSSAAISYQQACLDGLDAPELKSEMDDTMRNAYHNTSLVLAIGIEIRDVLNGYDQVMERRLLSAPDQVDKQRYPTWVSAGDRKILAENQREKLKPHAVVAKDGSGQFKTISEALEAYPKNQSVRRYIIYVKAGIYDEHITVTKDQENVLMYGDGPRKTIITGSKSNRDGYSTYRSASFAAIGKGFIAESMGFENQAGPEGRQAVALRVQSDMSAFYNCRIEGYQNTLYALANRQFYRNCIISGTVDIIFGDSVTLIQNSLIVARKPMDYQQNTITAQGRKNTQEMTGIVIQNCRIVPDKKLFPFRFRIPSYLGRPWKESSRTVVIESTIGDFIRPEGWVPLAGNFALSNSTFVEYSNRGPGAKTDKRVKWTALRLIQRDVASQFTAGPFLLGDQWLKNTGIPFYLEFAR